MIEEIKSTLEGIETRGTLNPEQLNLCGQLVQVLQDLDGIQIEAIGITDNMVSYLHPKSPCVWFTPPNLKTQQRVSVALKTFRNREAAVVSDYSFNPYKDRVNAIPFGAVLGKYVLPDIKIDMENYK